MCTADSVHYVWLQEANPELSGRVLSLLGTGALESTYPYPCAPGLASNPPSHTFPHLPTPSHTFSYFLAPSLRCAPGLWADPAADSTDSQNGPMCSGPCPAGYRCPPATSVPIVCEAGTYW